MREARICPRGTRRIRGRCIENINSEIEDILLDFASLYNEVTTSDLQGIATVEAEKIIKLIRE